MKSSSQIKVSTITFLITLIISIVIFGVVAFFAISSFMSDEEDPVDPGTEVEDPVDPGEITPTPIAPEVIEQIEGESFSVLIAGYDISGEGMDAMAVLDVDKEEQTVSIYPINTDTKVYVGHGDSSSTTSHSLNVRMGDLIKYKDMNYVLSKLSAVTGLKVDYFITLTAEGFISAFDEFNKKGYYTYKVQKDMEHLHYYSSDPDDPLLQYNISFKKGDTLTSGIDVYNMLRYKGDSLNDRMNRQAVFVRDVILKIVPKSFKEAKAEDMLAVTSAILTLTEAVQTNITVDDFVMNTYDLFLAMPDFAFKIGTKYMTSITNYK